MSSTSKQVLGVSLILVGLAGFSGCASKREDTAPLKRYIATLQEHIEELETSQADMQRVIELKNAALERQKKDRMQAEKSHDVTNAAMHCDGTLLPLQARAGACYARVRLPSVRLPSVGKTGCR